MQWLEEEKTLSQRERDKMMGKKGTRDDDVINSFEAMNEKSTKKRENEHN